MDPIMWKTTAVVALMMTTLAGCGGGTSPGTRATAEGSSATAAGEPAATSETTGTGTGTGNASTTSESGYFSSAPVSVIEMANTNACFMSMVSAVDLDGDGRKDLAVHGWCNQWGLPAGFDGPTPDAFHTYLNTPDGFVHGNRKLFGRDAVSLGGASRKVSVADLNGDGRPDLAYAINREDGRPIGNDVAVAAAPSAIVTSMPGGYSVATVGVPDWFHAVDVFQSSGSKKLAVFAGFNPIGPQAFGDAAGVWNAASVPLPALSGLTFRFMRSSPSAERDDILVTGGLIDASGLDVFTRTDAGWQRGAGYQPPFSRTVRVVSWNGDVSYVNRVDIGSDAYAAAGFDESCTMQRTPTSPEIFIGRLSANRLPGGYSGELLRQTDLPTVYDLLAFEIRDGALHRVDLGLNEPVSQDFFNFFECADVNGDGYSDIVVSHQRASGAPDVYLNDSANGFRKVLKSAFPVSGLGGTPRSILEDLDGDDIPELITFTLFSSPQVIQVYRGLKRLEAR